MQKKLFFFLLIMGVSGMVMAGEDFKVQWHPDLKVMQVKWEKHISKDDAEHMKYIISVYINVLQRNGFEPTIAEVYAILRLLSSGAHDGYLASL